ncbi:MAG: deoxyribonuclease IV [Planctomycetes bacterium]|nr:deoxyribonuclease IV [Planctomycetota bacterium]
MPIFGAHMSIAGGLYKAVEAAAAHGMDTLQLFTHSPSQWAVTASVPSSAKNKNQWHAKNLNDDDIAKFRDWLKQSKLKFPTAHDSYLINLASPDATLYQRSLEAFIGEMRRAEALGLTYLVMHPGTPTDGTETAGLRRIVRALNQIHKRCPDFRVKILLETTAGQGQSLGWRFEHLAAILDEVLEPDRLGVCLDTCHVFAAGYSLGPVEEYERTIDNFHRLIGVQKLKVFHLNDSKKPLGSRVDRHEHIGRGHLGLEPFRLLLNDARFSKVPMILETPKEGADGEAMDPINLRTLRDLVGKKE